MISPAQLRFTGSLQNGHCNRVLFGRVYTTYHDGLERTSAIGLDLPRSSSIPSSETSEFILWNDGNGMVTQGSFRGRPASNQGHTYGGRVVREQSAGTGQDQCYFPSSAIMPLTTVTGGIWAVQTDNTYRSDIIGFPPAIVGYYQKARPRVGLSASCSVTVPQRMDILTDPSIWMQYVVNSLTIAITQSSVTVGRAGAQVSRPFSF